MSKEIWIYTEKIRNELQRLGYFVYIKKSKSSGSNYLKIAGTPITIRISDHISTGRCQQSHVLVTKNTGIRKRTYRKRGRRQTQYIYGPDRIYQLIENTMNDCIRYRKAMSKNKWDARRRRKKAAIYSCCPPVQNDIA